MYIYYFSYGHNTNSSEFYNRVASAILVGNATLFDYKFTLEHFANIIPHKGSSMKGVLWRIPVSTIKHWIIMKTIYPNINITL